ncbi:hypothetical protein Scep_008073 [Stephania cephalantha]|uniref:Phytocyanin domain-containing protein n=1 Tax=Stephania cephalantha TaxID=152367 RepID=A0AAP0KB08_9MAGN
MNNNMHGLALSIGFLCFAVAVTSTAEASTRFKVGERLGWRQPDENNTAIYSDWAANNRFVIGDSLYFEYHNDSVLVVDKAGYYHCNTARPIASFDDGKTLIKLDRPGFAYFISGFPEHCKNGERLNVNVMPAVHPSPPSPPSADVPPSMSPALSPEQSSGVSVAVSSSGFMLISLAVVLLVSSTTAPY